MQLTDNQKKYIVVGVAAVSLYLIIRYTGPKSDAVTLGYDPTGNGGAGATNNANFNATNIAKTLYDAMKESGTDEDAIMNALKPLSPAQFSQVITKFGKKDYNKTLGNQYFWVWETPPQYGLKDWLLNELSESDYGIIRLKFKSLNYL